MHMKIRAENGSSGLPGGNSTSHFFVYREPVGIKILSIMSLITMDFISPHFERFWPIYEKGVLPHFVGVGQTWKNCDHLHTSIMVKEQSIWTALAF